MKVQEPKYKIVVNWIRERMNDGTFRLGEKLPSENELSAQFQVSRQTVRHAIDVLEQQKLVSRVQGSGTFVGAGGRSDRHDRYMNIAVVSTYVDSYIFPAVLKGLERALSKGGYTMQLAFTGNQVEREQQVMDKLLEKGFIDGLIAEPAKSALPNPNLHYYQKLMEQGVPVLFFNSNYPQLKLPYVSLDDEKVGQKATEYLFHAGHRKIGGIFKSDDGQGHLRYAGYMRGLQNVGLRIDEKKVVWMDTEDFREIEQWSDYLLSRLADCTGVVCYNDEVAHVLVDICQKRGIQIPDQLSLVGIDNSDLAVLGDIPITSFPHPMEKMGKKVAENMIKMIENPYFDGNYLFDSEVIERSSVKKMEQEE